MKPKQANLPENLRIENTRRITMRVENRIPPGFSRIIFPNAFLTGGAH